MCADVVCVVCVVVNRTQINYALKVAGMDMLATPQCQRSKLAHLLAILQDECEDSSRLLLTGICATLLATNSQLQRLNVFTTWDGNDLDGRFDLPRPLVDTLSMASSLEHLLVQIPSNNSIPALADAIPSLKNLRVRSSTLQVLPRHSNVHANVGVLTCMAATVAFLPACACPTSAVAVQRQHYITCMSDALCTGRRDGLLGLQGKRSEV